MSRARVVSAAAQCFLSDVLDDAIAKAKERTSKAADDAFRASQNDQQKKQEQVLAFPSLFT